ncbi:hypothetical protein [Maritimibacter sp. 55A14]|uniref:hypothetical protein n=1 Tax=Maritimibacter sp. 55A14 TaxID=2174844 RepID=UPI0011B1C697|nr:hypothetical protein [Maritimibacter sp. 55A14]
MSVAEIIPHSPNAKYSPAHNDNIRDGAYCGEGEITDTRSNSGNERIYSTAVIAPFWSGLVLLLLSGTFSLAGLVFEYNPASLIGAALLPAALFSLVLWIARANGERQKKMDR